MGVGMKKIAVFVEGQTEQIFMTELIKQIFDERKLQVVSHKMQNLHHNIRIDTFTVNMATEYYFVIYDCENDEKVKTDIIDNFPTLQRSGFSFILGIRDAFNPKRKEKINIEKLKVGLNTDLPNTIPVKIILAVIEIEAWFMAEETHYAKISPNLTLAIANSIVSEYIPNFNLQKDSTETILHPTVVLEKIYQAGGANYSKKEFVIKRVVSLLDYDNLYIAVRKRNDSLNELLTCLDGLIP
jgi:hypothetical protein